MGQSDAAEGQASSLGLNDPKGDVENTNTNYLGDDDGMIHENSQGQGTQKMRSKRSKKAGASGKDPSVRRRNVKQRGETQSPDQPSQLHSDRSNVPVELIDDKDERRRAGRTGGMMGSSREIGDPFNTTQTNELLNVKHSKFD